jgi:hypothetical protein
LDLPDSSLCFSHPNNTRGFCKDLQYRFLGADHLEGNVLFSTHATTAAATTHTEIGSLYCPTEQQTRDSSSPNSNRAAYTEAPTSPSLHQHTWSTINTTHLALPHAAKRPRVCRLSTFLRFRLTRLCLVSSCLLSSSPDFVVVAWASFTNGDVVRWWWWLQSWTVQCTHDQLPRLSTSSDDDPTIHPRPRPGPEPGLGLRPLDERAGPEWWFDLHHRCARASQSVQPCSESQTALPRPSEPSRTAVSIGLSQ